MRRIKVYIGTQWYDAVRIDGGMRAMVVLLDVHQVDGVLHAGPLIDVPHPSPQIRIVDDPFLVAFEMANVYGIEAHNRYKQSEITFYKDTESEIMIECQRVKKGYEPRGCSFPVKNRVCDSFSSASSKAANNTWKAASSTNQVKF